MFQYWSELRDERVMPHRHDVRPEDIYTYLGWLHLVQPIDGGKDFQYAVFNTRTVPGSDQDMTGKRVSDWGVPRHQYAMDLYGKVLESKSPVYSLVPERYKEDWLAYSRLCLPLGERSQVSHILVLLSEMRNRAFSPIEPTALMPVTHAACD